jgi:hypothetical protein
MNNNFDLKQFLAEGKLLKEYQENITDWAYNDTHDLAIHFNQSPKNPQEKLEKFFMDEDMDKYPDKPQIITKDEFWEYESGDMVSNHRDSYKPSYADKETNGTWTITWEDEFDTQTMVKGFLEGEDFYFVSEDDLKDDIEFYLDKADIGEYPEPSVDSFLNKYPQYNDRKEEIGDLLQDLK